MLDIKTLQSMNCLEKIAITKHAKVRLEERGIHVDDIVSCITTGEIIKQYEEDKPLPSCLILGRSVAKQIMHVVVSNDEKFIYLITAYFPNSERWEDDWKTRKE